MSRKLIDNLAAAAAADEEADSDGDGGGGDSKLADDLLLRLFEGSMIRLVIKKVLGEISYPQALHRT